MKILMHQFVGTSQAIIMDDGHGLGRQIFGYRWAAIRGRRLFAASRIDVQLRMWIW